MFLLGKMGPFGRFFLARWRGFTGIITPLDLDLRPLDADSGRFDLLVRLIWSIWARTVGCGRFKKSNFLAEIFSNWPNSRFRGMCFERANDHEDDV